VKFLRPQVSGEEAKAAAEALKLAQNQVKLAHARAVARAIPIDDAEAKRLSEQTHALTPDQALSLEQWHLAKFYHLETVGAEDVLFDKKGTTQRCIRHWEAALSHAQAIEQTASSINRNPETPQDWKKTAVQRWFMEQTGMTIVVAQLKEGNMEALTPELIEQMTSFVRCYPAEFRIGFGYRNLAQMPDQKIVGTLLTHYGIRRKRHRRQGTYSIDQDHLKALLAVVQRRQSADPEVQDNKDIQELWITSKSLEIEVSPSLDPANPSFLPQNNFATGAEEDLVLSRNSA
jgi:hypothetical protein